MATEGVEMIEVAKFSPLLSFPPRSSFPSNHASLTVETHVLILQLEGENK